jgi:L-serine dehydratase
VTTPTTPSTPATPADASPPMVSAFDLFAIGIGPSSSHTVGPMRAATTFVTDLRAARRLHEVARITIELRGSLAATGPGHGTVAAVLAGLAGEDPGTVDPELLRQLPGRLRRDGTLTVIDGHAVAIDLDDDLHLDVTALPFHPNGMVFTAYDTAGVPVASATSYSVGGGAVVHEDRLDPAGDGPEVPFPFASGEELLALCDTHGLRISDLVLRNESALRPADEVRAGLLARWDAMRACIDAGLRTDGTLPGILGVKRRAPELLRRLERPDDPDPFHHLDRVTVVAMAVNEENAAGGRVVTAPTNGAAGIIPAVLDHHLQMTPGASDDEVVRFLAAATAVGWLCKRNASISGAEVGCQGEVGSACAMAAAGLAEVHGGSPPQVENAAEIGLEHNLGLTCDPIAGLVQIPCIERNGIGAVKAITAARIALAGDGTHRVSLDQAIATMRSTGEDMADAYKETSRAGLAVNVPEC